MSAVATDPSAEDAVLRALLARVALWDRSAFAQLYDRTVERVYGLAHGVTHDSRSAEEVTEAVYLALWRQPRAAPAGPLVAWLMSQALGHALDRLERGAVRAGRAAEPLSSP